MSNVTLNTLVYLGEGIMNGASRFVYRGAGLFSGFSSLVGRIKNTKEKVETQWTLAIPVIAEEATSCACVGDVLQMTYVNINVRFDRKATAAHRTDVKVRIQNLVASTPFVESVENLSIIP